MNSSELAQRVAINEVAESMMAFNTNYKDTGLFGVYAVAKVIVTIIKIFYSLFSYFNYSLPLVNFHTYRCLLFTWILQSLNAQSP